MSRKCEFRATIKNYLGDITGSLFVLLDDPDLSDSCVRFSLDFSKSDFVLQKQLKRFLNEGHFEVIEEEVEDGKCKFSVLDYGGQMLYVGHGKTNEEAKKKWEKIQSAN